MWRTTRPPMLLLVLVLVHGTSSELLFAHGNFSSRFFSMDHRHPHHRFGATDGGDGGHVSTNLSGGCRCGEDPILPEEVVCFCQGSRVKDFSTNITKEVTRLSMVAVSIVTIPSGALQKYKDSLRDLILDEAKELVDIEDKAFYNLKYLRTISIKQAPKLKNIAYSVFNCDLPNLKILRIVQSGLEHVPNLEHVITKSIIYMVDLDSNKINRLQSGSVKMKTEMLNLDFNLISAIESNAFDGSEIAKLSLKANVELNSIHEEAFLGLKNIRSLDLSYTSISTLPIKGLEELEVLKLSDVYPLKVFPSVYHFKYIKAAYLTYPYHCCAFKFPATHDPVEFSKYLAFKENMAKTYCNPDSSQISMTIASSEVWNRVRRRKKRNHRDGRGRFKFIQLSELKRMAKRYAEWGGIPSLDKYGVYHVGYNFTNGSDVAEEFFGSKLTTKDRKVTLAKHVPEGPFGGIFHGTTVDVVSDLELQAFCGQLSKNYRDVECTPSPDAFNPCEDVMGNMLLRVVVWVVVVTSVTGNVAVMVVLMSTGACNSVSKFLMCNLAFADFCMGFYLLMIAAMDLHSMGTYFNYAIDWQHGYGCQVAGFLTVFATELSIYTLTVISVERWYAITHAINLHKRLKLRRAANVMSAGWIFAVTMATLPLANVNGYSRTSICLPMGNQNPRDVAYVMVLLVTNSMAFLFIFFCYGNMYAAVIRHQSKATANDMAVAKRMAMLVITDFVCWAPVAFFATTAVAGYPLIDVTNSKILLVFFYPLNSCANPFLYAIFTTQYRRDFLLLLKKADCFDDQCSISGRKKSDRASSCNVPPLQFSSSSASGRKGCGGQQQTNSCSSQMSTDNSMRVLRPSELSSQQDVFSTSGWEDQEAVQLWTAVRNSTKRNGRKSSSSSDDSGQCCRNYSSSSHSTTTHKGSPHPVKNRFVYTEAQTASIADKKKIQTTMI